MTVKSESKSMLAAGVLTDSRENRKNERLRVDVKVKYKVIQRHSAMEKSVAQGLHPEGRSVNISLCGLSIVTESALRKGEYLKLELSLPGRPQVIRALAEVMWGSVEAGQFVAGIRFLILLNQADDVSIRRFIEDNTDRTAR
jgi:hypothetical protein